MADDAPKPAEQPDIPVSKALEQVRPTRIERIVIHPWPKVVLSWPLVLVSVVFYFLGGGWWADTGAVSAEALGLWWMIVFLFSLVVQRVHRRRRLQGSRAGLPQRSLHAGARLVHK